MTLNELLESHCRSLRVWSKPRTARTAEQRCRTLGRCLGEIEAAELRQVHVERFVQARLEGGASRQTVNGDLAVLKAALNRAVGDGALPAFPCLIRLLRVGRRVPKVLTPEQVDRLIELAPAPVDLMLMLAADAGLRHQEILHLRAEDIDLAAGVVRVRAKAGWSPKAHHEREIPLTRRLRHRLAGDLSPWVFPGYEGGPLRDAHMPVRAAFEKAGLYDQELRPGLHSLRRAWATALLGAADIETVRQLGGWADLTTVQRYVTSTDDRKRSAIAALEQR